MKIELGTTVKDRITGITGIVMGRTEYLTGCAHIGIQRPVMKDGKLPDWEWFDETRIDVVKSKGKIKLNSRKEEPGGPSPTAPSM